MNPRLKPWAIYTTPTPGPVHHIGWEWRHTIRGDVRVLYPTIRAGVTGIIIRPFAVGGYGYYSRPFAGGYGYYIRPFAVGYGYYNPTIRGGVRTGHALSLRVRPLGLLWVWYWTFVWFVMGRVTRTPIPYLYPRPLTTPSGAARWDTLCGGGRRCSDRPGGRR